MKNRKDRQSRDSRRRQRQAKKRLDTPVNLSNDEVEKVTGPIDTVLSAAAMEETEDYLARGRRFERLSIEDLGQRWTTAFKAWCQDRTPELQREFDDAAAELGLRNAEPPFDTARDEIVALQIEAAGLAWEDEKAWEPIRARIKELLSPRGRSSH
jgi:hypothetical protein